MPRYLSIALLCIGLFAPALRALSEERPVDRYYFTGSLDGKYPIQMDLKQGDDGQWEGGYFYVNPRSTGERIALTGMLDSGGQFQLSEYTEDVEGRRTITGVFMGTFSTGRAEARGDWRSADGKRLLRFALEQVAGYRERSAAKRARIEIGEEGCPCADPVETDAKGCVCEANADVVFPVFPGSRGDAVLRRLQDKGLLDVTIGGPPGQTPEGEEDTNNADRNAEVAVNLFAPPLIGLEYNSYLYFWGAAHGMPGVSGINLLEEGGELRVLGFRDLVRSDPACLKQINGVLLEGLRKQEAPAITDPETWSADLTRLYEREFLIQPAALTFLYPPYEMGPYAMGTLRVNVPYRAIAKCIPAESPLSALIPLGGKAK